MSFSTKNYTLYFPVYFKSHKNHKFFVFSKYENFAHFSYSSQLPEHYPTPVQTLHAVLQRTRIPENALPWVDSVYCIDPVTGKIIHFFLQSIFLVLHLQYFFNSFFTSFCIDNFISFTFSVLLVMYFHTNSNQIQLNHFVSAAFSSINVVLNTNNDHISTLIYVIIKLFIEFV